MDATLQALGTLLLKAIPTFLLLVLLHLYLKHMFFGPIGKVLKERDAATNGARKAADAALALAEQKTAEFEEALRRAQAEIYREQEALRRSLEEARRAQVAEAKAQASQRVEAAKAELAMEVERLKGELATESEQLAGQILSAVLPRKAA